MHNAPTFYAMVYRGSVFLYEDDGNSTDYIAGKFANTSFSFTNDKDQ